MRKGPGNGRQGIPWVQWVLPLTVMAEEEWEVARYPGDTSVAQALVELSCVAGRCWGNGLEGLTALAGEGEKVGSDRSRDTSDASGCLLREAGHGGLRCHFAPQAPLPASSACAGRRVAGPRSCLIA